MHQPQMIQHLIIQELLVRSHGQSQTPIVIQSEQPQAPQPLQSILLPSMMHRLQQMTV